MEQLKKLYLVGCGGFGREVLWLAQRINAVSPTWSIQGFIDDNVMLHGKIEDGYSVLGGCEYLENKNEEVWCICAVGTAKIRKKICERLYKCENIHFATLVDPSAILSDRITIGEGSIICARSILTVDIVIGSQVIINLDCTIGHDAVIEDFATIYPSVNVSGNVTIGRETEIGTGSQIIQGKKVGQESIVGAGAVVIRDIPKRCTAVGSPAKPIKYFD